MEARIATIATTIISSMSVKPALRRALPEGPWGLNRMLVGVTRCVSLRVEAFVSVCIKMWRFDRVREQKCHACRVSGCLRVGRGACRLCRSGAGQRHRYAMDRAAGRGAGPSLPPDQLLPSLRPVRWRLPGLRPLWKYAAVMAMAAAFSSRRWASYSLAITRSRSSRGMEKVMVSSRPASSSGAVAPRACSRSITPLTSTSGALALTGPTASLKMRHYHASSGRPSRLAMAPEH